MFYLRSLFKTMFLSCLMLQPFFVFSRGFRSTPPNPPFIAAFSSIVGEDYANYYTSGAPLFAFSVLASGGVLANTSLDGSIHRWYQRDVRSGLSDTLAKAVTAPINFPLFKLAMGTPVYSLPLVFTETHAFPRLHAWSMTSLRTLALLAPQQVLLTSLLGSCRPTYDVGSKWRPFLCHRGVSGHAAYGAVPFLSMARLSQSAESKAFWYVLSVLPGLARINDAKHYPSQVWMGYALAWISSHSLKLTYRFV